MAEEEPDNALTADQALRERIGELLRATPDAIAALSGTELQNLVQELQVQNEELRQVQVELAHARDRYADLYDFAPLGCVTMDKDGKILEANLTAATMLGVERRALLGANISQFIARTSQDDCYRHRQAVFAAQLSDEEDTDTSYSAKQTCELEMCRSDATPLMIRLESVASDGADRARQCRTALIDITERKRAEAAVGKLNEELEQHAAEWSSALVMLCDVASITNNVNDLETAVTYTLKRVCEHDGWICGHAWLPAEDPNELVLSYVWYKEEMAARFDRLREFISNLSFKRSDGCLVGNVFAAARAEITSDIAGRLPPYKARLAEQAGVQTACAFPVLVGRKPIGVIEFFSIHCIEPTPQVLTSMASVGMLLGRVIERMRATEALRQSHERLEQRVHERTAELEQAKKAAEQADASKTRFLVAASHDLRQPLQSLQLYLPLLTRPLEPTQHQEIIVKMRKSLDSMGELLDVLLDLSRFERGLIIPQRQDFSLHELLEPVISAYQQQAEEKGLRLERSGVNGIIHSDPGLLRRVLDNLVANAIRYTEHGQVTLDCQQSDDSVRITVSDSGIGIAEEFQEKIFEEYYQLDNPVRGRQQGLGIGLSIVKHIATLLGHRLDVSSVPGEGSRFTIEVPTGETPQQSARPPPAAAPPDQKEQSLNVLLIEDDPAIADATTMLLESAGKKVHSSADGVAALARIEAGLCPDLIVTDYRLPGYNGIEVIRRIRAASASAIPAIMMTGDTLVQEEIAATELDNCTVLRKPVDAEQLIALIATLAAE